MTPTDHVRFKAAPARQADQRRWSRRRTIAAALAASGVLWLTVWLVGHYLAGALI